MLTIYRRHTKACTAKRPQHDRGFWRCNCRIYAEGAIGREYVRESLHTRSQEEASRIILEATARGSWRDQRKDNGTDAPRTVAEAIAAFLEDAASDKGRQLAKSTLSKYRTLLGRLQRFCDRRSLARLSELTPEALRIFRDTWPTGARATANNVVRLKAFCKFCLDNEWIQKNPAIALRPPKNVQHDTQKLPFTELEMRAIVTAARAITFETGCSSELETLILLMRHTGLRISDAVFLTSDRIEGDQLNLHAQKTGSYVSIPLPVFLLDRLRAIEPKSGGYLFVSGSTRLETATDLWRRKMNRVFERARVKNATPHHFRHTFAVDLLTKGVDIKSVSLLLGHSSVTITERFYAAWITARQQALSEQLRRTWTEDLAA